MEKSQSISSEKKLIRHSLLRTAICLTIIIVFTTSFFAFLIKRSEENRLITLTQSAARSFRPKILEQSFRDVQEQIRVSLGLRDAADAVIRSPTFEEFYSGDGNPHPATCFKKDGGVCWFGLSKISYLQPLYFNPSDQSSLFGYLEISVVPQIDFALLVIFLFALLMFSAVAVFVIAASTRRSVEDAMMRGQLSILRGVSHDLKTPISQLRKFHQVLESKMERSGEFDWRVSREIKSSVETLSNLLRESNLASIEEPHSDPALSSDLKSAAESYIRALETDPAFSAQGLRISLIAPRDACVARVSGIQFYRILDNLVRNAVDSVDGDSGSIEVTLGNFGGKPVMFVADSGQGIPCEIVGRIFEPNFTTKASRGTGLGLSVVKNILNSIGGSIDFEPGAERGTCFRVRFQSVNESVELTENAMGVI